MRTSPYGSQGFTLSGLVAPRTHVLAGGIAIIAIGDKSGDSPL